MILPPREEMRRMMNRARAKRMAAELDAEERSET
jgi:hypothetical protein